MVNNTKDLDFRSNITLMIKGKQIPKGTVTVSGAKNAATRLMAAALLTDEKISLLNFPTNLIDVKYKVDLLKRIDVKVEINDAKQICVIEAANTSARILRSYDYPIRTTYLLAAGQLNRNGLARIPYPGGCKIGDRKYDLHVMIWEKMGCRVKEMSDYIEIKGKLKPATINFPISTIGGTENALICGSGITGVTTIYNAYISPEVQCLIDFLRNIGANIQTTGNSYIRVEGNTKLRGTSFRVIPDRIEALTWIIYGVLSSGDIIVERVPFCFMTAPLMHLRELGVDIYQNSSNVYVSQHCLTNKVIQPFEVACGTYPGVISDMQPFFTLIGLKAQGISRIYDYRYPNRTAYLSELSKFCPNALQWKSGEIIIDGPSLFKSANARSTDLRGSMAIILAGLLADGVSEISNAEIALRGYDNLLGKLDRLNVGCEVIV